MKYFLRLTDIHPRHQMVFDDFKRAVAAACDAIEQGKVYPEEILAEDGRVVMTHDQIGREWGKRLDTSATLEDRPLL